MFGLHGKFSENFLELVGKPAFRSETQEFRARRPGGKRGISVDMTSLSRWVPQPKFLRRSWNGVSRQALIFALASFAFMSIFGMSMGMETKDGQMSSCPFMTGEDSMCQMNVTEHISRWQQIFLGIPSKTNFLAPVLLLMTAFLIAFAKSLFRPEKLTELAASLFAHQRELLVEVFDPLIIAFSDGILHPKIYEPANI